MLGFSARSTTRNRLASMCAAVLMASGLVLAADVERAEAALTDCANNHTCAWVHANYKGPRAQLTFEIPNFKAHSSTSCQSGTWNDCISSVYNRTDCYSEYYHDWWYSGSFAIYPPNGKAALVTPNDVYSSLRQDC